MMRPTMYLRECVSVMRNGTKVDRRLQQRWESLDGKQAEWRDVEQMTVAAPKMTARV